MAKTRNSDRSAGASARQLTHDLANALGGARLRVTLMRSETNGTPADTLNLEALDRLLNQACAIEEKLHASIRRLFPKDTPAAANRRPSSTKRVRTRR